MVDTAAAAPTTQPTAAAAGAPVGSPPGQPAAAGSIVPDRRAALRSQTLAELSKLNQGSAPAADAKAEPAKAEPEGSTAAATDPAAAVDPPAETKPMPEAEPPGMAAVRKAEQHQRKQLAEERAKLQAELATDRASWQTKLDKAAEVERKLANARRDPIGLLKEAGFADDDLEALGRTIYGASPAGQKDPRFKAAGEAELARRGESDRVQKLEARIAAFEESQTKREQQSVAQQRLDTYADGVTKAVGDATPITKIALAKNPEKVRAALIATADRLYMESGPSHELRDVPTATAVLAAYEAERVAELELYGVDPKAIARPAPRVPAPPAAAPAPTLAPSGGQAPTTQAPRAKPTREEAIAGLRKLNEGAAS